MEALTRMLSAIQPQGPSALDKAIEVLGSFVQREQLIEQRARLWLADVAARTVAIHEASPSCSRAIREAVIATRRFARHLISEAELGAARNAVWHAPKLGDTAADRAAWAAAGAAWFDADHPAFWATLTTRSAVEATRVFGAEAVEAEQEWQTCRLLERLESKRVEDWPLPVAVHLHS